LHHALGWREILAIGVRVDALPDQAIGMLQSALIPLGFNPGSN
jgi:hypothetical protein